MTDDEITEAGDKLLARYNQTVRTIRDNPRLTPEGRRGPLARAWLTYRREADKLLARDEEDRAINRRKLEARLFHPVGIPTDPVAQAARQSSYRDALDRARALKSHTDARRSYELAVRTGDTDLARAITMQAVDAGWPDIVNSYTDEHPHYKRDLEQLWRLVRDETEPLIGMQRVGSLIAGQRPNELATFTTDQQLERLADAEASAR